MQLKSQLQFVLFVASMLLISGTVQANGSKDISPATLKQNEMLENSIKQKVEPCDDFYQYACGNWENQEFTKGENISNHFILRLEYDQALKNMLRSIYPDSKDIKKENQSFKEKALAFYYSCKNVDRFDLFDKLKPAQGIEWPIIADMQGLPAVSVENFNVFTFLADIFAFRYRNFLFIFDVFRQDNGTLKFVFNEPSEEDLSITDIKETIRVAGCNETVDQQICDKYLSEIQETHAEWSNIYNKYREYETTMFTYKNFKETYPQFALLVELTTPNRFNDNDLVECPNTKYFEFFMKKEWQPDEIRRLYNYAMAVLFKRINGEYFGDCESKVLSKFHLAINYMYREHYYGEESRIIFKNLKENIFKNLMDIVNENRLELNEQQLKAVKDKLSRTYVSVGNVPDYADDAMVEEFYHNLPDMDTNDYVRNVLLTLKQKYWERINCPAHMECLEEIGDGTYSIPENDLVIVSMTSMAPFMYDGTFDPLLIVSLMGILIGHEYSHSIDTDALTNPEFYNSTYEEFKIQPNIKSSIDCTNEQFETEYLRQLQVDLLGARAAFRAYSNEYNAVQPNFTKRPWQQVFFLNYAQYFCHWWMDYGRFEYIKRTNHVAMNMKEFAEAYNCPVGSKMNPEKKCLLY